MVVGETDVQAFRSERVRSYFSACHLITFVYAVCRVGKKPEQQGSEKIHCDKERTASLREEIRNFTTVVFTFGFRFLSRTRHECYQSQISERFVEFSEFLTIDSESEIERGRGRQEVKKKPARESCKMCCLQKTEKTQRVITL